MFGRFSKRIRKHTAQTPEGCGQACVAMVLDCSLKIANKLIGCKNSATLEQIINTLKSNGFSNPKIKNVSVPNHGSLPDFGLLIIKAPRGTIYHIVIIDGDDIVDSNYPKRTYNLETLKAKDQIHSYIKLQRNKE